MILLKIISDKSIHTDSNITVYTIEGSTVNLTFKSISTDIYFSKDGTSYQRVETKRNDIIVVPDVFEFQITNVTANDTGLYSILNSGVSSRIRLNITSKFIVMCTRAIIKVI